MHGQQWYIRNSLQAFQRSSCHLLSSELLALRPTHSVNIININQINNCNKRLLILQQCVFSSCSVMYSSGPFCSNWKGSNANWAISSLGAWYSAQCRWARMISPRIIPLAVSRFIIHLNSKPYIDRPAYCRKRRGEYQKYARLSYLEVGRVQIRSFCVFQYILEEKVMLKFPWTKLF